MDYIFKNTINTRYLANNKKYIRTDCPFDLSEEEIKWLLDNNYRTIIDLREEREYLYRPCVLESICGFDYYHMPVTGGGGTPKSVEHLYQTYLGMLDETMDQILDIVKTTNTNVMFFCTAGKDRTGVVGAVILNYLGYSDEDIVKDYMISKDNLYEFLVKYVAAYPEIDLNVLVPSEDNIKNTLKAIKERYSSNTA